MLADPRIGHKIVRKADGPGAPGSATSYPGNLGYNDLVTKGKKT